MSKKKIRLAFAKLLVISILVTIVFLLLDLWLLSGIKYVPPIDALFLEGILITICGTLLLIGRGGINLWSLKAIILSALAEALYDTDTVGPSEVFRRDRWTPKGFVRLALVLIMSGVFMILAYFIDMALPF